MQHNHHNTLAMQLPYLQQPYLLSHLKMKTEKVSCFGCWEGGVDVDMDNITFGPREHTVRVVG